MDNSVIVKLFGATRDKEGVSTLDFTCTLFGEDLEIRNNSNIAYIPQIKNKTIHYFSDQFSIGDVTYVTTGRSYDWSSLIKFLRENVHKQPPVVPEQGGGNRRRTHKRSN